MAQDDTPGIDAILYSIHYLKNNQKYNPDYVICLQCTVPFRTIEHIDEAIDILIKNNADSLVSVSEAKENPYWMKK